MCLCVLSVSFCRVVVCVAMLCYCAVSSVRHFVVSWRYCVVVVLACCFDGVGFVGVLVCCVLVCCWFSLWRGVALLCGFVALLLPRCCVVLLLCGCLAAVLFWWLVVVLALAC